MGQLFKRIGKLVLPAPVRRWMRRTQVRYTEDPPYGCVDLGDLRRTAPVHFGFGTSRGTYIDRYYIDRFLERNADCVRGRVLEIGDDAYTKRMGGDKVTQSDVLDVRPGSNGATIIADLAVGEGVPVEAFDCIILTQTLNNIYDVGAAIRTVYRSLKPGGVVLVSVPAIAQVVPDVMEMFGDFWRFTSLSLSRLFEEVFPADSIQVESEGNVLAALGYLHGLAAEEFSAEELDLRDPNFQVSVLLKAVKPLA